MPYVNYAYNSCCVAASNTGSPAAYIAKVTPVYLTCVIHAPACLQQQLPVLLWRCRQGEIQGLQVFGLTQA